MELMWRNVSSRPTHPHTHTPTHPHTHTHTQTHTPTHPHTHRFGAKWAARRPGQSDSREKFLTLLQIRSTQMPVRHLRRCGFAKVCLYIAIQLHKVHRGPTLSSVPAGPMRQTWMTLPRSSDCRQHQDSSRPRAHHSQDGRLACFRVIGRLPMRIYVCVCVC